MDDVKKKKILAIGTSVLIIAALFNMFTKPIFGIDLFPIFDWKPMNIFWMMALLGLIIVKVVMPRMDS